MYVLQDPLEEGNRGPFERKINSKSGPSQPAVLALVEPQMVVERCIC